MICVEETAEEHSGSAGTQIAEWELDDYVPEELRSLLSTQTAIPSIAKDPKKIAIIEEAVRRVPTQHHLHRGEAREMSPDPCLVRFEFIREGIVISGRREAEGFEFVQQARNRISQAIAYAREYFRRTHPGVAFVPVLIEPIRKD